MKFELGDIVHISNTGVIGIIIGIDNKGEDYWVGFKEPLPDSSDFKDDCSTLRNKAVFERKVFLYKNCFPFEYIKFDKLKPFLGFVMWIYEKDLKKLTLGKDNVQTTTKS